jgi:hypothetical protein
MRWIVYGSGKAICLLALVVCFASIGQGQDEAHSMRRGVTSIPRLMGRTVKNMVTFHDKASAFAEWGIVAAAFADSRTTQTALARCPGCVETNFLYGSHPNVPRIYLTSMTLGLLEASVSQFTYEQVGHQYGLFLSPFAISGAWHAKAALHNAEIKGTK